MARTSHPNATPQPMPGNVRGALAKRNLTDAFRDRPTYQQNDYLKWIASANGVAAKQQRLDQLLDELQDGGKFRGEAWSPPAPVEPVVRKAKS